MSQSVIVSMCGMYLCLRGFITDLLQMLPVSVVAMHRSEPAGNTLSLSMYSTFSLDFHSVTQLEHKKTN